MNYAELVAEVAQRTGADGFAMRAAQYVTQAETELGQHFKPQEYPWLSSVVTGGTNWLMSENPEIYLAAVLKQFYFGTLDTEKATISAAYLNELVENKKSHDRVVRYSGERPANPGAHP
jgi:hypothetical protein